MAKHRTVYTYNAAGTRCMVEHSIKRSGRHDPDGNQRDRSNRHHQAIVERASPKRGEGWTMRKSGGAGSGDRTALMNAQVGQDWRGYEPTYWAEWVRQA